MSSTFFASLGAGAGVGKGGVGFGTGVGFGGGRGVGGLVTLRTRPHKNPELSTLMKLLPLFRWQIPGSGGDCRIHPAHLLSDTHAAQQLATVASSMSL